MTRAAALENPDIPNWTAQALDALEAAALSGRPFDARDLTRAGLPKPPHEEMWSILFREAARARLIRRPCRSKGRSRVWLGVTA